MKGGFYIKMVKSKIISVSAPEELITFCINHELSPSELFQCAALQQKQIWDRAHTDTEKLLKIISDFEKRVNSHWDYLHEKGLEADYNKYIEKNGYN